LNLALIIGNRFNPWHFKGYARINPKPEITVFRAQSEIQDHFDKRNDADFQFRFEKILFDSQSPNPFTRFFNVAAERYAGREPRVLPFHERLRGFDVVQSWELFTDWTAEAARARRKFNVPLAVMVWDNIPFNMENTERRRANKREALAAADLFIAHTERTRRTLLLEGADATRIAVIPPGVDVETFSPGQSARADFGLNDADFVILFVGWFLPRKGLDFLLLALRGLLDDPDLKGRRFRLLMVGSGPGRERVEALIRRLRLEDVCVFAGSLPYGRMPSAFRSADAFVLPSIAANEWQEQFGMSLIEAMACGVPVVTTLSGSIPEIVGDCAVPRQPNDFIALQEAISELAKEPTMAKDMAERGRLRATRLYSLDCFASALSDAYKRI
jgi:glycosyltransferase involved in cell wall biosynthesis